MLLDIHLAGERKVGRKHPHKKNLSQVVWCRRGFVQCLPLLPHLTSVCVEILEGEKITLGCVGSGIGSSLVAATEL